MKTCILIPAFNEEPNIGEVVKKAKIFGYEVIVIDDGSSDNTGEVSKAQGALIIKHERNLGKGRSLQDGFKYALMHGFEVVITMDGDGQHRPESIPNFIEKAKSSDAGLIIGNRMKNTKEMPLIRVLTNRFMSWLISKKVHQKVPDTQCGYRLIRRKIIEEVSLNSSNFEIESEVIIKAARLGVKIESIPIMSVYATENSQINPIVDTIRFIKMMLGN